MRNYQLPERLNGHLTRTAGEAMGDYAISYEGTNPIEFANYLVTVNPGTLTITAPNPDDFSVNADGTEYTIHTATGWNVFCEALQDNNTYNHFSGKTVKLGANITVTQMAGGNNHAFTGTFDGNHKTLTLNYGTAQAPIDAEFVAPFVEVSGGTEFINLNIDGHIYAAYTGSSDPGVGGLIGHLFGGITIEGCTSTVEINSTKDRVGGFVGLCEHAVTFTNCKSSAVVTCTCSGSGFVGWSRASNYTIAFYGCLFNGKVLKKNGVGSGNGGFVGWKGYLKTVEITNCLVDPAAVAEGETMADDNSATFCRYSADTSLDNQATTITNCYYTETFGNAQGNQAYSISGGNYVTVGNAGTASSEYNTSGLTFYNAGLKYGDVLYAAENDVVSLMLGNTVPEDYFLGYSASPTGATLSGSGNPYTLTMPDADVVITANTNFPSVSYIDENGETQHCTDYLWLTGTETTLGAEGQETWYVADGTLDYSQTITLSGDVHLILKDNAVMNVGTEETPVNGHGIAGNHSISIYAQSVGESQGQLHLNVNADDEVHQYCGIIAQNSSITINGGKVSATGYSGIFGVHAPININGGQVTTTGNFGIYTVNGSVIINGGQVTATGNIYGIYAQNDNITLGWTNPTDCIYVNKYYADGTLSIAEGKAFIDEAGQTYSGTIAQVDGAYAIDGKRLYPNCVVMKQVAGYGEGNGGWVFIASPVAGSIAPSEVHNLIATTEEDYDLYRFNQSSSNGKEWQNWKAEGTDNYHFNLEPGKGYLYATKEDRILVFAGEYTAATGSVEVPLDYDENAQFADWNLVGNPFTTQATMTDGNGQPVSFYVINGQNVVPYDGNATTIEPCTGVMVKAEGTGEKVRFTSVSPDQAPQPNKGSLQIALSQVPEPVEGPARNDNVYSGVGVSTSSTTLIDNAIISFNEGSKLGKFYFGTQNANIYIPQGNEEYAIACGNGQGEMPLNFKAIENGEYTISVKPENVELAYLHLIDNLTGADVDLLVPEFVEGPASYTFTAKTTDYESRFKLVFSTNDADGPSTGSGTFAFYSNGNIIVNGEGTLQVIDMTGRIVLSIGGHTRCVPTTGMTAGVYVLRLINGEKVRTQKIVIE